jgi:uncharacterized protein (TIGR03437 family)
MRSFLLYTCLAVTALAQNISTVGGNSTWSTQIFNVALDSAGNLYVPDSTKAYVYKITPQGITTNFAGTGSASAALGDGGPATSAGLSFPRGVAVGADGSVYIGDCGHERIRKVAPNGTISTFAGTGTFGFAGDGQAATAARLNCPEALALDAKGNLLFVDYNNRRVRKITTDGIINTVAGTGQVSFSGDGGLATAADSWPFALAVAPDGTFFFTDAHDNNPDQVGGAQRVRKVSTNGVITTVAGAAVQTGAFTGDGGPAAAAKLFWPQGVALDTNGNLYISDTLNYRIRKIDPSGMISTYAGTGTAGNLGDGGPATKAQLNWPMGIVVDPNGNLFFADALNIKIREISAPPFPTIRSSSPVLTSFMGNTGFSSNTYVEIYGANFITSPARLWAGGDFTGSNAPTVLDGVSVTVNGRPAFIYYISATQININTPDDNATGPVAIQVKTPLGLSNIVTVNRSAISPTLQSVPQFNIGGKQYVVALTPDFKTFIGRPNMIQGVAFQTGKPGDVIAIYALGCGPTSPPTQAGVITAQGSPLALPFQLKIGGVDAPVSFAGMVGGTIGLYQFNVTIPVVPSGDQGVELIVNGVSNNQSLYIVIG